MNAIPPHARSPARRIFLASALLFILWEFLAGTYWKDLFWGLHHLAFYPSYARLVALLAALVLLILAYRRAGQDAVLRFLNGWPFSRVTTFTAVVLLSFPLFYLLRIRHWFLGDAHLLVHNLGQQDLDFALGAKNDLYLHAFLHQTFPSLDPWSLFALTSCAAGALHILGILLIVDTLGRDGPGKVLAFVIAASTGALQLFCGYVENYALMAAFLTLALAFLVKWRGHKTTWLAAAASGAFTAFLLHPVAVFSFAPLICAVGFQVRVWSGDKKSHIFGMVALLTAVCAVSLFFLFDLQRMGPADLGYAREGYGLFSAAHLADVANELLLLVPVHGLLLVALVLERGDGPRRAADPLLAVLAVCAAAAFATSFALEPLLGSLDWDLLSLYAIPVGVLTAYVARHRAAGDFLFLFPTVALFHLLPWIFVNADLHRGAAMVEAMVERDYHHRGERNAKLGAKIQSLGLYEAAIRQYRKAQEWDPGNCLAYQNLGLLYHFEGRIEAALEQFALFVDCADSSIDIRFISSLLAYHQGRFGEAAFSCAVFLLDHPDHAHALSLATRMAEKTGSEVDRMMLQVALLYSQKKYVEAAELCVELAEAHKHLDSVVKFSKEIYAKMARL